MPATLSRHVEQVKRILAVCGLTEDCPGIARYAASFAASMKAELFILTVIYNPFGVKGLSFPRPSLQEDLNALVNKIRSDVQAIIDREKRQGIRIRHMIREGKPAKLIARFVAEKQVDLLVLPAHSKTGLEYLLTGGLNKTLLRKMPCSILFFKKEPLAIEEEEEQQEEDWGRESMTG